MTYNLVTVDVEDWFHILDITNAPDLAEWDQLESRVERNVRTILDEFEAAGTRGTFFYVGWVAERFPELVRETHRRGHEIACHGYAHQLVRSQGQSGFAADIRRAKRILEDITGGPVYGYRAPGFSITAATPWAFDEIAAAGFEYDSSVFPGAHGHGGLSRAPLAPHWLTTAHGKLFEFPSSVVPILGRQIAFFGGGYLRLFPYWIVNSMARLIVGINRPVIYYLHPREVDPFHPRIPMNRVRYFKSYVNLESMRPKLRRVLRQRPCISCRDWMVQHRRGADQLAFPTLPARSYLTP